MSHIDWSQLVTLSRGKPQTAIDVRSRLIQIQELLWHERYHRCGGQDGGQEYSIRRDVKYGKYTCAIGDSSVRSVEFQGRVVLNILLVEDRIGAVATKYKDG